MLERDTALTRDSGETALPSFQVAVVVAKAAQAGEEDQT